jgi:hypothetical protein
MDPFSRTTTSPLSSGVIEMRRLAALHAAPARTSMPTLDLVLSVGAPVSALGRPDAVRIERPRPRWPEIAVPALAVGVTVAIAALLFGGPAMPAPATEPVPAVEAPLVPPAEPVLEAAVEPTVEPATPAAESSPEPAAPAPAVRTRRPRPEATPTPEPTIAEPAAASAAAPSSSLDALLARATGAGSPERTASTPEPSLRRAPSRDEVQRAMTAIAPAIAECAEGEHGLVSSTVTFGDSGRVRSALVNGELAGTPAGSCMARALRTIELPPFSQVSFTVQYPFAI